MQALQQIRKRMTEEISLQTFLKNRHWRCRRDVQRQSVSQSLLVEFVCFFFLQQKIEFWLYVITVRFIRSSQISVLYAAHQKKTSENSRSQSLTLRSKSSVRRLASFASESRFLLLATTFWRSFLRLSACRRRSSSFCSHQRKAYKNPDRK